MMSEPGNSGKRVPKRSEKALAIEQQAPSKKRKLPGPEDSDAESDEASSTVTGKKQCRTVSSVARAVTTRTPNDSDDNEDSSTMARKKQGRTVSNVTRAVTNLTIRAQKRQEATRQAATATRTATTDGESGTKVPDIIDLDNDTGNDDCDVVAENATDELGEYQQSRWSTIILHLPFAG
jgi:hypothetical protein